MRTWDVELRGTITRDIKRYECDAETEAQVREICARDAPNYRVHAITLRQKSGPSDTTTPATPATGTRRKRNS